MPKFLSFLAKTILWAHITLFVVILFFSILYSYVDPPFSMLMLYRKIFFDHDMLPKQYVPLTKIPRVFKIMIVRVEDYKFYQHFGLDIESIKTAYQINKQYNSRLYGASTITQQLARTLFLTPHKTYLRKYIEALIAVEMDLFMKKDRILELYINNVEWGKGVFGAETAARFYFKKPLIACTNEELIRLVTILPSPLKYNVYNFFHNRMLVIRYGFLEQFFQ